MVYAIYPSVFIEKNGLIILNPKNFKISAFYLVLSTRSLPFVVFFRKYHDMA